MANNPKPLVPNYKKNVGRLAADRFDFQKHINGEDFRHHADQIDLVPNLVINSQTYTNVQSALAAIAGQSVSPIIPATAWSTNLFGGSFDTSGEVATFITITPTKTGRLRVWVHCTMSYADNNTIWHLGLTSGSGIVTPFIYELAPSGIFGPGVVDSGQPNATFSFVVDLDRMPSPITVPVGTPFILNVVGITTNVTNVNVAAGGITLAVEERNS